MPAFATFIKPGYVRRRLRLRPPRPLHDSDGLRRQHREPPHQRLERSAGLQRPPISPTSVKDGAKQRANVRVAHSEVVERTTVPCCAIEHHAGVITVKGTVSELLGFCHQSMATGECVRLLGPKDAVSGLGRATRASRPVGLRGWKVRNSGRRITDVDLCPNRARSCPSRPGSRLV
jgi:hypothetical protein